MNILVTVKQVIDVELNIHIKEGKIVEDGLQYAMSAWDENAVEAGVVLKENQGGAVSIVSIGEEKVQETLRKGLAMGADKAIHVLDSQFNGADSLGVAQILSKVVEKGAYDLVLTGKQAQDTDNSQTGGMLAEILGWPCVTNAIDIQAGEEGSLNVTRVGDVGKEEFTLKLPAVVTANDSLNEPRLPSLRGIMQAKKKPIEQMDGGALGLTAEQAGSSAAKTEVLEWQAPQGRQAGKILKGDPAEMTAQVIDLLRTEAKVL